MYIVHIQRPCKSIRSGNSYQEGIRFHPILRDQMILGFYTNFFFFFFGIIKIRVGLVINQQ